MDLLRYGLALLTLTLTGCGLYGPEYPQPVDPYSSADFACPSLGSSGMTDVDVTLNKCVNANRFKGGVYVRMHIQSKTHIPVIQNMVLQDFESLNFFDQVLYREPTIYINAPPHHTLKINGELWYVHDDPFSTSQIRDMYGEDVLIADVTYLDYDPEQSQGFDQGVMVNLIDPRDGATIIMLRTMGGGWLTSNVDVINPVFTVIREWIKQSSVNGDTRWQN